MDCTNLNLASACEIGLVLTSDTKIRKLNREYRGKDKATDVLSFSMIEGEPTSIKHTLLGDVVISVDTMKRQAKKYDVYAYQEFLRLLIHGILHLFGYDHENVSKKEAIQMRTTEDRLYHKYLEMASQVMSG